MPRTYSVEFEAQTIAAASGDYDLFSIAPGDDRPIELVEILLNQSSELQEAQEEKLRLRVIRGHATASSGGAAATARPYSPADTASAATVRTMDSTIASAGTPINVVSDDWEVRAGYVWGPRPQGMGVWCSQAEGLLVVRLMAAAADDLTASGTVTFIEYP